MSTLHAAIGPVAGTAFKIFAADQWAQFQSDGIFQGAPIDIADGYIHMSTAEQLGETLTKHFAGQFGLVVAEVDLAGFGERLKWELSRGNALFPHLYVDLPWSSIVSVEAYPMIMPIPARLGMLRNVGKAALKDFAMLEIQTVQQLSACRPDDLFAELQRRTGVRQDPCVWDVFAATIHQARCGEAKDWWAFTAERKARNTS